MFKLLALNLVKHPKLGDLDLSFVEENEINNTLKPYTSIIIGSNGTGKSFILRTIVEIFRQFNDLIENKKNVNFSFHFSLKYSLENDVFEIITRRYSVVQGRKTSRQYVYLKNRPVDVPLYKNDDLSFAQENLTGYEISIIDLKLPSRILASSVFLTDRFPFATSLENDFYQYLGVRRTANSASTKSFVRNTVKYLYEASFKVNFRESLGEILEFLEFEKRLSIQYNTRYNKIFFTGDLTVETFKKFYERWWELKDEGVDRKRENAPWGQYHYQSLIKNDPFRVSQIVNFLNDSVKNGVRIQHKPNSKSKLYIVEFFSNQYERSDFSFLEELEKLSILTLDQIKIIKKDIEISVEEMSSGEYHLILNILGIFAKIDKSSLILIDEPEISLHPNWQMKYITFLKNVFLKFSSCHFIITTHSHFLVSDLEGPSSAVVSLKRDQKKILADLLEGKNTFGWSAEEILYIVFNVKTTRNFYLEADLRELLYKISMKSQDFEKMESILNDLKKLELTANDPLLIIINKAEEYLYR